jgi:hypothetical protein
MWKWTWSTNCCVVKRRMDDEMRNKNQPGVRCGHCSIVVVNIMPHVREIEEVHVPEVYYSSLHQWLLRSSSRQAWHLQDTCLQAGAFLAHDLHLLNTSALTERRRLTFRNDKGVASRDWSNVKEGIAIEKVVCEELEGFESR